MIMSILNGVGVPVVVTIAERPDGNLKGLPHGIQSVLHHFSFVANSEPTSHTHTHTHVKTRSGLCVLSKPPPA